MTAEGMQPQIVVLSPHLDDAALSLGSTLTRWAQQDLDIVIINVFSESTFAPRAARESHQDIASLRRAEDQAFTDSLGSRVTVVDLRKSDAPLRLGNDAPLMLEPPWPQTADTELLSHLVDMFRPWVTAPLVCVPAGVGGHVDHCVVRKAAERLWPTSSLLYYEDQPYAALMSSERLKRTLAALGLPEVTLVLGGAIDPACKREHLRHYTSQFGAGLIRKVVRRLRQLGGERYWLERDLDARRLEALKPCG